MLIFREVTRVKAVPNIISIFRICLVPVFIVVYFSYSGDTKIYAVLVYALATFSDFLDGFLARKFKASSNLGKILDPLGDKMMTISVMACITIDKVIPVWAVFIAGVKELLMGAGGIVLYKMTHAEVPPSNIIGKTSTVIFFLVCVTLMLFRDLPGVAATALISFAIALMFLALASYIRTYIKIMKNRGLGGAESRSAE